MQFNFARFAAVASQMAIARGVKTNTKGGRAVEKFSVATIAHVTGFTVSTVTSWAAKQNKTTKDGLTVPEIMDFLSAPKHNNERSKVDEKAAARLRTALEVMGAINKDFTLEG